MIRKSYLFVYYLTLLFITVMTTLLAITSHPSGLQYLSDKFLKTTGVSYNKIHGSVLGGFTLYNVNYFDAISIETLQIKYNLLMLLKPTPQIQKVKAYGTLIKLENFPKSDDNSTPFEIPDFVLSKLQLNKTQILFEDKNLSFDLDASKIHFDRQLDVKKLSVEIKSDYGLIDLKGKVQNNQLLAKSDITPTDLIYENYLAPFNGFPATLNIDLNATMQSIVMHTHIDQVTLSPEQNISLENTDLILTYVVQDEDLSLNASYGLVHDGFEIKVKQTGYISPSFAYTSDLNGTFSRQAVHLPFQTLQASVSGDLKTLKGQLHAGPLDLSFSGKEYQKFILHAQTKDISLSNVSDLVKIFRDDSIRLTLDARLDVSPFILQGTYQTHSQQFDTNGSFTADQNDQLLLARLHPKPNSQLHKTYAPYNCFPLDFIYYKNQQNILLNMEANASNLTLVKKENFLNGWGNIGSAHFDTHGRLADKNTTMNIQAKVPSLDMFLTEFGLKDPKSTFAVDAQVDINTTLTLSEKTVLKSRINLPWYLIRPDMQTLYKGEDVYLESTIIDKNISIDNYHFNIMNHPIYSQRPSKISIDTNGSIVLNEVWIYDNLLLSGIYDPAMGQGHLRMQSDRFNYQDKDGNVTLKADIQADLQPDGRHSIKGSLTLLEGIIAYEPTKDYTISDDIIVIQDIKPRSALKPYINIHINAKKPIAYKIKDVDIRFSPDIILWQEPDIPLGIYGMATIHEGEVTGGEKHFKFDKSEIYFNGSNPINPHLNLNIHHHTLDYVDIEIFVTNTLGSPVIILSSKPAMSQNDIMSYILFGEPASSAFDNSGTGTNTAAVSSLLLATGLKSIINDTAGVNIDTLNILTNEEGTLGYEIGTRFSKDVRVVYKSDTASSVILQYSLSRSIRLDIDVHETGQGVSILYVKDFGGF